MSAMNACNKISSQIAMFLYLNHRVKLSEGNIFIYNGEKIKLNIIC